MQYTPPSSGMPETPLAIAHGGTGQATAALARSALGADTSYEPKTLSAKGDLLSRSASAAVRVPVGADGQMLVADSAQASGIKWAASGITALAQSVADSAARLALTSKPLGYRAHQADNHHVYEVCDTSHLDTEAGWADMGDVLPFVPSRSSGYAYVGGVTSPNVGQNSTAEEAEINWSARPSVSSYAYQWMLSDDNINFGDIGGATARIYVPGSGDQGKYLKVKIWGTNAVGTSVDPVESAAVGPIGPAFSAPNCTAAPTISGNWVEGQTLTANEGTWEGNPTPSAAWQWQSSPDSSSWSDVEGATGGQFGFPSGAAGTYFRVKETRSNSEGEASAYSDSGCCSAP